MAPRTRFFRHGELPLVLLWLVRERPRHGYDLMAELTRLFGPRYRPSPGTIYPAVEALETEGLIVGSPVEGKVVYELTAPGELALQDRAHMLADIEYRTGVHLVDGGGLEGQIDQLRSRLARLSGRVDTKISGQILERAAGDIELLATTPRSTHTTHHARMSR